jgi:hypothetical protein
MKGILIRLRPAAPRRCFSIPATALFSRGE